MRRLILPFFLFFMVTTFCQAQQAPAKKHLETQSAPQIQPENSPIYVLIVDDKSLELNMEQEEKSELAQISPDWIQSIFVLKGQDAIDEFGARGANGVVKIELKKENWQNIPSTIKTRLQ